MMCALDKTSVVNLPERRVATLTHPYSVSTSCDMIRSGPYESNHFRLKATMAVDFYATSEMFDDAKRHALIHLHSGIYAEVLNDLNLLKSEILAADQEQALTRCDDLIRKIREGDLC